MPAQSDPSVTRESLSRSATVSGREGSGTTIVKAESPLKPSTCAPLSIDTMSPGSITRGPGMPCTTSEFTEAQIVLRYPGTSMKFGSPPAPRMTASAIASSSPVVTPGLMADAAVTIPGRTIIRSSSGDL